MGVFEEGARAEVDESEAPRLEVEDEVLVLDVPVDDAHGGACEGSLHHLLEEVSGELLLESALVGDVVEEVGAGGGALHDNQEAVLALEPVQETHHPHHILAVVQETHFQRHTPPIQLNHTNHLLHAARGPTHMRLILLYCYNNHFMPKIEFISIL